MPKEQALHALQVVGPDVLGEREVALVHLAGHGLGPHHLLLGPRVRRDEGVERLVDEFPQGLRVLHLLEFLHPLLVGDPGGLQLLDLLAL